jgi:hypothetical protein
MVDSMPDDMLCAVLDLLPLPPKFSGPQKVADKAVEVAAESN